MNSELRSSQTHFQIREPGLLDSRGLLLQSVRGLGWKEGLISRDLGGKRKK